MIHGVKKVPTMEPSTGSKLGHLHTTMDTQLDTMVYTMMDPNLDMNTKMDTKLETSRCLQNARKVAFCMMGVRPEMSGAAPWRGQGAGMGCAMVWGVGGPFGMDGTGPTQPDTQR
jgi:hypothetical protein